MGKREHGEFFLLPQLLTRVGDVKLGGTNTPTKISCSSLFINPAGTQSSAVWAQLRPDREETRPHEDGGKNETHLMSSPAFGNEARDLVIDRSLRNSTRDTPNVK